MPQYSASPTGSLGSVSADRDRQKSTHCGLSGAPVSICGQVGIYEAHVLPSIAHPLFIRPLTMFQPFELYVRDQIIEKNTNP